MKITEKMESMPVVEKGGKKYRVLHEGKVARLIVDEETAYVYVERKDTK